VTDPCTCAVHRTGCLVHPSGGRRSADQDRPQSTKAVAVGELPRNPDLDDVRSMYVAALVRTHARWREFRGKVLALGSKPE
jgi:hypothetical protein